MRLLPITALILIGALGIARADVYRWVDEQGVPHYSDEWVPGSVVIKTVKPHPVSADTTARATEQKGLGAAGNRAAQDLGDQANTRAVQQDMTRTREAQCKAARERYQRAIEARRVYKDNTNGEREYLSEGAADAYREQARKAVLERCGSVPEFVPDQPLPEPQPIEPKPIPEPKVNPAAATSR